MNNIQVKKEYIDVIDNNETLPIEMDIKHNDLNSEHNLNYAIVKEEIDDDVLANQQKRNIIVDLNMKNDSADAVLHQEINNLNTNVGHAIEESSQLGLSHEILIKEEHDMTNCNEEIEQADVNNEVLHQELNIHIKQEENASTNVNIKIEPYMLDQEINFNNVTNEQDTMYKDFNIQNRQTEKGSELLVEVNYKCEISSDDNVSEHVDTAYMHSNASDCSEQGVSQGTMIGPNLVETSAVISDMQNATVTHNSDGCKTFHTRNLLDSHALTYTSTMPYNCEFCTQSFKNKRQLTRHAILHKQSHESHTCATCLKSFKDILRLERHMTVHKEDKLFKCRLCPKKFKLEHLLKKHIISIHKEDLISDDMTSVDQECILDIYVKRFNESKDLVLRKSPHPMKTHTCGVCNKQFRSKAQLTKHNRVHTGEEPYSCNVCSKRFKCQSNWKKHYLLHTDEKPYGCEICLKRFTCRSVLKLHARVHTDEGQFTCEICTKNFKGKEALINHIRTHTGERPYECEKCPKRFISKRRLKSHARVHSDERPFTCEICSTSFKAKERLKRHVKLHTNEKPYECEICSKRLTCKSTLKLHARVHTDEKPFTCEVCTKSYKDKGTLKQHVMSHTGEKPYKCEICSRRFSRSRELKLHSRLHSDEEPFTCGVCTKSFKFERYLKQHERLHTDENT